MLEPDSRTMLSSSLLAPSGYTFDSAIGTTFGLDLTTLLHIPLFLALQHDTSEDAADGIEIIESLERVADRLTVFAQAGRIGASGTHFKLYGLLEDAVVECATPYGSWHPKVWLIRFVSDDGPTRMRLLVLSRNLTRARTWDIAVTLEGEVGSHEASNVPLAEWVRALPSAAIRPIGNDWFGRTNDLADDVLRTEWELPDGFDTVAFHPSQPGDTFLPSRSGRLAVVSPYLRRDALRALAQTTDQPSKLLTRDEELARIAADDNPFEDCFVLNDAADDPTEESSEVDHDLKGLHAKVLLAEMGDRLHVYAGSANATNAAMTTGINAEFMVELSGPRRTVGGINDVFESMGALIVTATSPEEAEEETSEEKLRRKLDLIRHVLAEHSFELQCEEASGAWRLKIVPSSPLELTGVDTIEAWPITLDEGAHSVDASALFDGKPVSLRPCALGSVTRFVAFRLTATDGELKATTRAVLNLPCRTMPEERRSAIVTSIISNRDAFLRYVRLLLHDPDDPRAFLESITGTRAASGGGAGGSGFDTPILEELVRAFSRNPDRLRLLQKRVKRVLDSPDADEVVPMEFRKTWAVFEEALEAREARDG